MSDLPTTFTNASPVRDLHPDAHNDVNTAVNDLTGRFREGTGSPEGVVTAPVGTVYQRTDGAAGTALYVKETGSGNTGWVAKPADATLLARANHTGTQSADTLTDGTTNKAFLATERTKLTGIATAATANDTDANLKARANHTGTQLAATISDFTAAVGAAIPVAPSTEIAYAQITTDQAFTVDTLNIDLVSGLAVTIPDLAVPVYVEALIAVKHSVASAVCNANLCKTSPTPTTILDALAMGFTCVTTIGFQSNCHAVARIPANTPCTVQLYVSGTGGTLTVLGQTYAPSKIWAVTV